MIVNVKCIKISPWGESISFDIYDTNRTHYIYKIIYIYVLFPSFLHTYLYLVRRSAIAGDINKLFPPLSLIDDVFSFAFRPAPARILLLFVYAGSPDTASEEKERGNHFPGSDRSRSFSQARATRFTVS